VDAFRALQPHRPLATLATDRAGALREPLFYNRLVVDDMGRPITPAHPEWGTLAQQGVRRVEDLLACLSPTAQGNTGPARAFFERVLPACFRTASALPEDNLANGAWVGTEAGPYYLVRRE
jgi:hypothetical protein